MRKSGIITSIIAVLLSISMITFMIVHPQEGKSIEYNGGWTEKTDTYTNEEILSPDPLQPQIIVTYDLHTLAQNKLSDLLRTGYWSHSNSDGCNFSCRVNRYSLLSKYSWVGENLYRGVCSVDNAYRLWKTSPTHYEILQHASDEQVLVQAEYKEGRCYIVLIKGILK